MSKVRGRRTGRWSTGGVGAASGLVIATAAVAAVTAAAVPAGLDAQDRDPTAISFESDLPRTLVFVEERGEGGVAGRDLTLFLREAGFPVIDPALAHTAAQRELVREALAGDQGAATQLGRDFGAQVLVLGRADWGARPDPVDGTLVTATSEVEVRAIRLDRGEVVATARDDARVIEATEQAARTKAIREATRGILQGTALLGQLMNDWEDEPWQDALYWVPDPGSVPAATGSDDRSGTAPGLAILSADVSPATGGTTRGLGVVQRGERSESLFNPVRLEGVVVGEARSVQVEGHDAVIEELSEDEARRLGLEGQGARRFWAETQLPMSRDTVRVVAEGSDGTRSEAMAAPRIDERWAVVIGIGEYRSPEIPDLEFAPTDARAIYDFLRSDAAGPFEEDHILLLEDGEATGDALREALFVFLQQADWDDLVVIYYAGHGAPDPNRPDNLYLLPTDADLGALASTGFPMWDVKTALRRQIAAERVIVIADACHSAGANESSIPGAEEGNAIAGGLQSLFTPSRRLTMTAADTNEFSLEDARWGGHGVFTYFLLDALTGAGDANGNGIVTFNEAYDYVSRRVTDDTQGRQHPQRAGFGDVPLAVVQDGGAPAASGDTP